MQQPRIISPDTMSGGAGGQAYPGVEKPAAPIKPSANSTFQSDNPASSSATSNSSNTHALNNKCGYCNRNLDGSNRMVTHVFCNLRFCYEHLQELAAVSSPCPRCRKTAKKEDYISTPSLSSSQRNMGSAGLQTVTIQNNQRMKLMSSLESQTRGAHQSTPTMALLYDCPICNLSGLQHNQLLDHSKMHANIPGKCPICALKYNRDYQSKHLYGHLMLRHKDNTQRQQPQASSVNPASATNNSELKGKEVPPAGGDERVGGKGQVVSMRSNQIAVATSNQIQLQASKGIQQSQQHKQPGVPIAALQSIQQVNQNNLSKPQIKMPTTKDRKNNNLTLVGAKHQTATAPQSILVTQQNQQSVLSNMQLLKTQNFNPSQALSQGSQAQTGLKKKASQSRRQSLTSAPSHQQLLARQNSTLNTRQGVKSPLKNTSVQVSSSNLNKPARLKGTAYPAPRPSNTYQQHMLAQIKSQEHNLKPNEQQRRLSGGSEEPSDHPLMTNQWLQQGLLGVYTFSVVKTVVKRDDDQSIQASPSPLEEITNGIETPTVKTQLQLTSQYLSSMHKSSLQKRQSLTPDMHHLKVTDLEKYLKEQSQGGSQDKGQEERLSAESEHTVDGLSSASSAPSLLSDERAEDSHTFDMSLGDMAPHKRENRGSQKNRKSVNGRKSLNNQSVQKKNINNRPSIDTPNKRSRRKSILKTRDQDKTDKGSLAAKPTKKNRQLSPRKKQSHLKVPIYLEEIQRICFPQGLPSGQTVLIEREAQAALQSLQYISTDKISPTDKSKPPHLNVAQSPHRQQYFSSGVKFGLSPTNASWSQSMRIKQPMKGTQAGNIRSGIKELDVGDSRNDRPHQHISERHKSVPRFNNCVSTPQMMLVQQSISPKAHQKIESLNEPNKNEPKLCTLEEISKFHKTVFYTTRTADDHVQYLSILVCAQPHLESESTRASKNEFKEQPSLADFSDVVISDDEDEETGTASKLKVVLQPFVFVMVTSQPVFESALGSQMLDFIYQQCFMPFYRRICSPSLQLSKQLTLCKAQAGGQSELVEILWSSLKLESAVSILFDLLNMFYQRPDDVYRSITWKDPTSQSKRVQSLTQFNQLFLGRHDSFFECNFSFQTLLSLIQIDDLIKLFSCLLLEKKVVLVADNELYQQQMAPVIQGLLKLLYPLDHQVFTNISYTLSEDMVFYMEKPGSLIMGMPKQLWLSHGQRVFTESFDTYIVVYDIQEQRFHLKMDDDPIGLPRTFSKLLRRTVSTIDRQQIDFFVSFQLRQAFFNTILLLMSFLKSKDSNRRDKILKAQALGIQSKDYGDGGGGDSDESVNSVQTIRDGQRQYPYSQDFLKEFKGTTTFIDLSEKLERKDASVAFIESCLVIIEQQKLDWFVQLLHFQASRVYQDLAYLVSIAQKPQQHQSPASMGKFGDFLTDISLEEILATLESKNKSSRAVTGSKELKARHSLDCDYSENSFNKITSMFYVQRRFVQKNLRMKLTENLSAVPQSHSKSKQYPYNATMASKVPNQPLQLLEGGQDPAKVRSFHGSASKTPICISSFIRPSLIGNQDPQAFNNLNMPDVASPVDEKSLSIQAQKQNEVAMSERRSPMTPNGNSVRNFALEEEADALPPQSQRAARYGSTHKPQIAFKQVISSQSPRHTSRDDNQDEETKHVEESKDPQQPKKSEEAKGGFFSMLTNFFSTSKPVTDDQVVEVQEIAMPQSLKDDLNDLGKMTRKSSKSMQVVQPLNTNFLKPIDMTEVAKIKTLTSGLNIMLGIHETGSSNLAAAADSASHRKQKSSITDLPKAMSCLFVKNEEPILADRSVFGQQQKLGRDGTQPQPHIRQETATFVKDSTVLLYSSNKRQETAQFASSAKKITDAGVHSSSKKVKTFMDPVREIDSLKLGSSDNQDTFVRYQASDKRIKDRFVHNAVNKSGKSRTEALAQPEQIRLSKSREHGLLSKERLLIEEPESIQRYDEQPFASFQGSDQNFSNTLKLAFNEHHRPMQEIISTQQEQMCLSARERNNDVGVFKIVKDGCASLPAQDSIGAKLAGLNRGSDRNLIRQEKNVLKVGSDAGQSRLSHPFLKDNSPNASMGPFWSVPQDMNAQQKRFSLNVRETKPDLQKPSAGSSKGSANVANSNTAGQVKSGKESSLSGHNNFVRTTTITLENSGGQGGSKELLTPSLTAQQARQAAQGSTGVQQKAYQFKSEVSQQNSIEQVLSSSQNSQKLKITISKLQSKQNQSEMQSNSNQKSLKPQTRDNMIQQSHFQSQQHSQSVLSFKKLQKQGNTMRNVNECVSPKIVTKKQQAVGYQSRLSNSSKPEGFLSSHHLVPFQRQGNQSVIELGSSGRAQKSQNTSQTNIKKQLNSSSQNLQKMGSLQQPRQVAQRLKYNQSSGTDKNKDGIYHSSGKSDEDEMENLTPFHHDERPSKKNSDKMMKGRKVVGEVPVFSPRESQSPQGSGYKTRPKAYSQISRGVNQGGGNTSQISNSNNASYLPQKMLKQNSAGATASSKIVNKTTYQQQQKLAMGLLHNQSAAQVAPPGSLAAQITGQGGLPSQLSSQSKIGGSGSSQSVQQSAEVLQTVLKKSSQRQQAPTKNQFDGTTNTRSHQHRGLLGMTSQESMDKSKNSLYSNNGSRSIKWREDNKRNSMTQLPKGPSMLTSQQLILASQAQLPHAGFSYTKVDLTSLKEQQTPTDFSLDSSQPQNRRKLHKLSKVAEEKKGDDEQVEMENLTEVLESSINGHNRIRSISHQYPSQVAQLRASQDKMLIRQQQQLVGQEQRNAEFFSLQEQERSGEVVVPQDLQAQESTVPAQSDRSHHLLQSYIGQAKQQPDNQ